MTIVDSVEGCRCDECRDAELVRLERENAALKSELAAWRERYAEREREEDLRRTLAR